jgi:hypothetical protein
VWLIVSLFLAPINSILAIVLTVVEIFGLSMFCKYCFSLPPLASCVRACVRCAVCVCVRVCACGVCVCGVCVSCVLCCVS